MPEILTPADVEAYTKGRLDASDPETQRGLNAALARVRRFCGWHVSPVETHTIYMDVPCSSMLVLPTLKIVSIDSITVDGTAIDVSTVHASREAPGVIERKDRSPWSKLDTSGLGQIEVELTHGFTAVEAADFREVVLQLCDIASISVGTGGSGPLMEKTVDDVTYRWSGMVDRSWGIAKNPMMESVLYQFRLLPVA